MKKILILLLVAVIYLTAEKTGADKASMYEDEFVNVQANDSIWQIAENLGYDIDTRIIVSDIMKLNPILRKNQQLKPGQVILVPGYRFD